MQVMLKLCLAMLLISGCTAAANRCVSDTDCADPMYPFCDVNGEYVPSGGETGICTLKPDNCPIERCGCTPGEFLGCSADTMTTCNADGNGSVETNCVLGCSTDKDGCAGFAPSNGLGDALKSASSEPDVVIPDGATIDTDKGTITSGGSTIAIKSTTLQQVGQSVEIQVFIAKSIAVSNAKVHGNRALALVAASDITFSGLLDLGAGEGFSRIGPGSQVVGDCVGGTQSTYGGGGGNATVGAKASNALTNLIAKGGLPVTGTVLIGGCRGGIGSGMAGFGGGAVQAVSLSSINVAATATFNVNGAGGYDSGGGGSGGLVILESPHVSFLGAIYANGGAGGACAAPGEDGHLSLDPAIAPSGCGQNNATTGGAGGTLVLAPVDAHGVGGGGGAGGAVGRLRVNTLGTYDKGPSTVIDALATTGQLVSQ